MKIKFILLLDLICSILSLETFYEETYKNWFEKNFNKSEIRIYKTINRNSITINVKIKNYPNNAITPSINRKYQSKLSFIQEKNIIIIVQELSVKDIEKDVRIDYSEGFILKSNLSLIFSFNNKILYKKVIFFSIRCSKEKIIESTLISENIIKEISISYNKTNEYINYICKRNDNNICEESENSFNFNDKVTIKICLKDRSNKIFGVHSLLQILSFY